MDLSGSAALAGIRSRAAALATFARFVWGRFWADDCFEAAAALSYTTLFALVPLSAVALGVIASFAEFAAWSERITDFVFSNFVPAAARVVQSYLTQFAANAYQLTTVGVIALAAKLAKADGTVTHDEVDVFKRVFPVPREEEANVGHLFNLAKQDVAGFDSYARQLAALFRSKPGVLEDLLDHCNLKCATCFAESSPARASVAPLEQVLARVGHMPLPPYIDRADTAADRERYQTVYADKPGAVAAPTAGLHFDAPLLERLDAMGVGRAFVTLHVGAGTFQPVRVDDPTRHPMHREWIEVDATLVERIAATRAAGGRVVAVGTTVVRALETCAASGEPRAYRGDTQIFIYPGHRFRIVDALVTNFHLPESTLLMLVSAFAGREFVLAAYRHAVTQRYRFYSYGDAMLLVPPTPAGAPDAV